MTEWLEADGLGGFASGTAATIRTRRYHALLLAADPPPARRLVLVNGVEATFYSGGRTFALSSHRYTPDVVHPDGAARIRGFSSTPWPQWVYHIEGGIVIRHELFVPAGCAAVAVAWQMLEGPPDAVLVVRPLMSGREYHALHRRNAAFRFDAVRTDGCLTWRPYDGIPGIVVRTNGSYAHHPEWFLNFQYDEERARGLDHVEDLASPGGFSFGLARDTAVMLMSAEGPHDLRDAKRPVESFRALAESERTRRERFASPLARAADAYIVRRGHGKTIVAGYPWFTDWGRDSFIALRGLCLATGRLEDAREILLAWARVVDRGMVPNRFLDDGAASEFNAVDASLWFVVAADEYLTAAGREGVLSTADRVELERAVDAIVAAYAAGTRYGIRADDDGLLRCGEPGVQLTWMDARVDGREITPRIGKPVEIQALWLAALTAAARRTIRWHDALVRGRASFEERFWNGGYLHDVVDVNHEAGTADPTFRPNQILAVGGLPVQLLEDDKAAAVVAQVETRLWTPMGLRSLAPDQPGYAPRYEGGPRERDAVYHQGTVWPWLAGPFIEAWVRVRGDTPAVRREARTRFLVPLLEHLDTAGLGHISEIADGDPPHTARGCPFQAWSVGEALRLERVVLSDANAAPSTAVAPAL